LTPSLLQTITATHIIHEYYTEQQPPFYSHYTGQYTLADISSQELEDFVGAKFYCLHALAKKGKVFPYSLPSVEPGADPSVQAVSPQVT